MKPYSYYWIKRHEPDGYDQWEPAQFMETRLEKWDYWSGRPTEHPSEQFYWRLLGSDKLVRQVYTPGASNRWDIGPELTKPT